ncbi:MAG: hypothetical protein ACJAYU_001995 [Bradymonadia bacterium]|jgi:hypothetical protein
MSKTHEALDEKLRAFIAAQQMFFVATAPLDAEGFVNVSPKGLDSFAILDETRVAYVDLTGSGAETIAHLRENGRITLMWCAFSGAPNIVRIQGQGRAHLLGSPEFVELAPLFPTYPGARSIVVVEATRISDSCGYTVPRYEYQEDRDTLLRWAEKKGSAGLREYRAERNAESVDGLPAFEVPED